MLSAFLVERVEQDLFRLRRILQSQRIEGKTVRGDAVRCTRLGAGVLNGHPEISGPGLLEAVSNGLPTSESPEEGSKVIVEGSAGSLGISLARRSHSRD